MVQLILGKRYTINQILTEFFKVGIKHTIIQDAVYNDNNPARTNISIAHKECIRYAKENDLPYTIVAEDDVMFTSDNSYNHFNELLNTLPDDWDIFLGDYYYYDNKEDIADNIVKLKFFSGLHFYAVNKKFYDKFLLADERKNLDVWLSKEANIYGTYPLVAIQKSGYSEKDKRYRDYGNILDSKKFPLYKK